MDWSRGRRARKTMPMTGAELADLITALRQVETDTYRVEAKRAELDLPKSLRWTLSALSNTPGGGVIILGIDEESGFEVVGVRDPKKVSQDLGSLFTEMEAPIRGSIEVHRLESKAVIVAEIPEADIGQKPIYYRNAGMTAGAFIRVADGDRRLTPYEVQVMLASRGQPREDETPVPGASLEDLDREMVAGLLARKRSRKGACSATSRTNAHSAHSRFLCRTTTGTCRRSAGCSCWAAIHSSSTRRCGQHSWCTRRLRSASRGPGGSDSWMSGPSRARSRG